MSWLANAFIVAGLWLVGEKRRAGFVCSFVGESIWVVYSFRRGMWDLASICVVFAALAAINWKKWA